MNTMTPWLVCFGVLLVYPAVAFAIGFYVGRRGVPFYLRLERNPDWYRRDDDGGGRYGVDVE